MLNCGSSARIASSAPTFTTSEAILLLRASCFGVAPRFRYSL